MNFLVLLSAYDGYIPLVVKSLQAVFTDSKTPLEDIITLSNAFLEFLFCC